MVEMENSSRCCGGAGIYSMVQPDLSGRLLRRKLGYIADANADEVATANPGCVLQLEQGLRQQGSHCRVRHVVDLLDEAYRLEDPAG